MLSCLSLTPFQSFRFETPLSIGMERGKQFGSFIAPIAIIYTLSMPHGEGRLSYASKIAGVRYLCIDMKKEYKSCFFLFLACL